jgi:hypothetical protein
MNSPSRFGSRLSVLALSVGSVLGLATLSQAFTIITLNTTVEKISIGNPAANGPSSTATGPRYIVDDTGCFMVFTSSATNLVPGQIDTNGRPDVFLYTSCGSETVTLVSHVPGLPTVAAGGTTGGSDQPVISPDSGFVVFRSSAANLVPGTGYAGQTNVFLWDRTTDTFSLVSHDPFGLNRAGDNNSQNGVISRTTAGRPIVAFESLARNLRTPGTNGASHVYRYDGSTGIVQLVSLPNAGLPGNQGDNGSFNPAIDGPGTCIVYESLATNLVTDDPGNDDVNNALDVFRWSSGANPATIVLSHRPGINAGRGVKTGDRASSQPSIADNCERFAFQSLASDLGQADANSGSDVFHEGNSGNAVLVSHRSGSPTVTGNAGSGDPILSRDGNWVAYASFASDVAGQIDTGSPSSDVFLHDVLGNKSVLVSHTATNADTVAGGESFAPEVSTDGRYVAYASDAKDLDPNQNDGNGSRDVFHYNRVWNTNMVGSPRFASIAITGEALSFQPAISGNGWAVAFTGLSGNHTADDTETSGIPDAFVFKPSNFIPHISVRSTTDRNILSWIMPPVDYVGMRTFVRPGTTCTDPFPPAAGTEIFFVSPPANTKFQSPADGPYAPGTTLCYSIYIQKDGELSIPAGRNPGRTIVARTLENTTGTVTWAANLSGTAALTQVGIGTQNLIAVANEGGVYGITRGATAGGLWPSTYRPFRATFNPIQGRPPILPISVLGSSRTTFVGSQDGRVYAYDSDRGVEGVGGALWYTSPSLGTLVQPGMAGMFTLFGGVGNHLLTGVRNGVASARAFSLNPFTGVTEGGPANFGVFQVGAINTTAAVDYTLSQVYFTSLEFTAGAPSLWCVELNATGFNGLCWPPQTLPSGISGGPVQRNGRVYVGDDAGQVWAFNAATGAAEWGPFTGCGGGNPIKSFVLPDRQGTGHDLYYATSSQLCAITDDYVGGPVLKWQLSTIPGPSAPILARIAGIAYIWVGSSNGNLYQIQADNPAVITNVLVRTGATIGAAAYDGLDNMLYVGTDAGSVYGVQAPLP